MIQVWRLLHARNMRIAVAVIFPGERRQQPTIPVKNAAIIATKAMMKSPIIALPISREKKKKIYLKYICTVQPEQCICPEKKN